MAIGNRQSAIPIWRFCGALVLAAAARSATGAGGAASVVHTAGRRLEGRVRFKDGGVVVGREAVRWDDVLLIVRGDAARIVTAPHAVCLRNGEVWPVELVGVSSRRAVVKSPLFGAREVAVELLSELAFLPLLPRQRPTKPGTLCREEGEPIPGALIWIDEKQIALDSPLGVLTLPRKGAVGYVFPDTAKPGAGRRESPRPADRDELHLVDGTVLFGRADVRAGRLRVQHVILGALEVPSGALRAVVRHRASVVHLAEEPLASVDAMPLIADAAKPERTTCLGAAGSDLARAGCLRAIRVWPKTTLRCRLPKRAEKTSVLRTALGLTGDSRGEARVRITAAGRVVFDETLAPGGQWKLLSLELPKADELTFAVDFGARVRFPCTVLLGDPLVVNDQ